MENGEVSYWYISFATNKGFLGATVVIADNPEGAIEEATSRNLNPGGEAAIWHIPLEEHEFLLNRLVDEEELLSRGFLKSKDRPLHERIIHNADIVCQDCNQVVKQ